MKIASIVEGHGEAIALPILLRRLGEWLTPEIFVDVLTPIRVHRDRFIHREEEFQRHLQLAAAKCGENGWILVLLDADDDCPAELGASLLNRARVQVPHRRLSVVFAKREYESWFIAAAESLNGHRGFVVEAGDSTEAETPRNAKGWIKSRMADRSYGETTDQPGFSARMDLSLAGARSRSFRKLVTEWQRNAPVGVDSPPSPFSIP